MTYDLSPTTSTYGQQSTNGGGVREQARQVGSEAAHAGGAVAQTAKEQGTEVGREAARQARNLYGEARTQLTSQAGEQQRRAATGLRSLADEMRSMAEQGGQAGPVSELARQAADRVHGVAGWLDERQPGDLITEVRDYARRNPGTFLVGAAVLGVLAGRLTRSISAAGDDSGSVSPSYRGAGAYDPERTAVIPTQADTVPQGGHLDPTPGTYAAPTSGGYADPTPGGYTDPAPGGYTDPVRGEHPEHTGTGQPLPPVSQTDPLPGVPSSGTTRP
ncbi:hypothetical protein F8271_26150 [Micromonospora sp. ALFpr18c]|uniref:hypothetical protein n=1 Tax=unclassified Micromonospora TaxID=2617518 RepID=UPI00124B1144|nr:hypothetical protein [Micromonospora sp. ALFpr18c]KAB1931866.1 hypothetical protein F8271_26150 [Micromonospora sp. ALFpr18c]